MNECKIRDLKNVVRELQAAQSLVITEYEEQNNERTKAVYEHLTKAVKAAEFILEALFYAYEETDNEIIFSIFADSYYRNLALEEDSNLKRSDFYKFKNRVGSEWLNLSNFDCDRYGDCITFTLKV